MSYLFNLFIKKSEPESEQNLEIAKNIRSKSTKQKRYMQRKRLSNPNYDKIERLQKRESIIKLKNDLNDIVDINEILFYVLLEQCDNMTGTDLIRNLQKIFERKKLFAIDILQSKNEFYINLEHDEYDLPDLDLNIWPENLRPVILNLLKQNT